MREVLFLLEHLALKTFCESVVESLGNILKRHFVQRYPGHDVLSREAFLHWNGPKLHEASPFLARVYAAGKTYKHTSPTGEKKDAHSEWKFEATDYRNRIKQFANGPSKPLNTLRQETSKFGFLVNPEEPFAI